ncbi:MAG: hypothetical protein ACLUQX_08680 [Thomasclavelia spiroformis]|jgi:hypothetical protein
MKNREKFAKEILDIAWEGGGMAVTKENKIVCYSDIPSCVLCLLNCYGKRGRSNSCRDKLYEWAESEYVEKPTITSKEKAFLDTLVPDCKYIARDGNNRLYIYGKKPIREDKSESWVPDNSNYYCATRDIFGNMFDFIKWGDVEPWRIEDLKKLEVRE